MFILRKICQNGTEFNIGLGSCYSLIHKFNNENTFNEALGKFQMKDVAKEMGAYIIIIAEANKDQHLLYQSEEAYIMTESGKTFTRLHI